MREDAASVSLWRVPAGLVCHLSACFTGAVMTFQHATRSSGRALVKLIVMVLLLSAALAVGAWWVLATGWDALLDTLPIWLPHTRS
jgi:uncharacterized protein involved in cysteine biosynthesis